MKLVRWKDGSTTTTSGLCQAEKSVKREDREITSDVLGPLVDIVAIVDHTAHPFARWCFPEIVRQHV